MAVSAYAAVVSLIDVLDRIQDPARHRLHFDRKQIEALQHKVSFLQDFLELYFSKKITNEMECMARQISNVASEAEDIIDSHVVDQIRKGFPDRSGSLTLFCKNIERVMEEIDSIEGKLMMIKEVKAVEQQQPRVYHVPPTSPTPPSSSSGKNTMVGFDERLNRIMDVLTVPGHKSRLQILPVVGMGGIGKTTLARNVFDHSWIGNHFDVRLWVTISQAYSTREILRGLLRGTKVLGGRENNTSGEDSAGLGEQLYKSLYDRRYLVVMDDVWSTKVWDDLRMFFPDNKNGSRIMVTTRLSNVADSLGSSDPFEMDFLDKDQSWNLFCEKAFTKEGCPPELEGVGRNIAKGCKGLPLAIAVIGGLLSKSDMTREYWELVAKDVSSFANSGDDEHCLKMLSLSYNQLPLHLKPCFLYMRVFPEDNEIEISKLMGLWVAEGFLRPIKDKTLERAAKEYLKDLIGRNLVLRCGKRNNWATKTCRIHDLLRDLCIRESHKEHFYHIPKSHIIDLGRSPTTCFLCNFRESFRWICLPRACAPSQPKSLAWGAVCEDCNVKYPQLNELTLVEVAEVVKYREDSVGYIMHHTKLRHIEWFTSVKWFMPKFKFADNLLNLLWNLQTLSIDHSKDLDLPPEIWEMPQLRHLIFNKAVLPDPPPLITQVDREYSTIILKNLQTLEHIRNFRWSEDVIERIPNLEKLGIDYRTNSINELAFYSLHSLGHLHKLESLRLDAKGLVTLKNIPFPHSLKKLTLRNCKIPWEEMTIIGSLPNLEVLKLYFDAFKGAEWNPVEGEFLRLKRLVIYDNYLVRWGAEKIHFPNLKHLEFRYMKDLEEIPSGIGEIETLRLIHVDFCGASIVNSAKEILEEQLNFGNEDLQLYVNFKLVRPGTS